MPARVMCAALLAFSLAGAAPQLTLIRTRPVIVKGSGFKAHERVELELRGAAGTHRESSRAGADGTFSGRFSVAVRSRCAGFSITARGASGSYARFLRRPPLNCE